MLTLERVTLCVLAHRLALNSGSPRLQGHGAACLLPETLSPSLALGWGPAICPEPKTAQATPSFQNHTFIKRSEGGKWILLAGCVKHCG